MDPLEFLSIDVLPFIFQHFTVKNILQVSLLSLSWNDAVNDSSCMEKIWLRFYPPIGNIEVLKLSKRNYQNFKLQRMMDPKLKEVFERFRWKRVMMRDIKYEDTKILREFMSLLAPSIREIEWWMLTSLPEKNLCQPVDFHKLQKLECSISPDSFDVFHILCGKNPRLKEVKLTRLAPLELRERNFDNGAVRQFLKLNRNIKHLALYDMNIIFQEDICEMNLESFKATLKIDDPEKRFFVKFIESQLELEKITLFMGKLDWHFFTEIWGSLRCCKEIEINTCLTFMVPTNLTVLPNVKKLRVEAPNTIQMCILCATPNLVKLQMSRLTHNVTDYVAHNLKSLQLLKYFQGTEEVCHYEELKRSHTNINRNIQFNRQTVSEFIRDISN